PGGSRPRVSTVVRSTPLFRSETICINQLPYTWNGTEYSAAGTYEVTLTSTSGCDSVATLILTLNPFVTSPTDETICINQLPYTWNGNNSSPACTHEMTSTSTS